MPCRDDCPRTGLSTPLEARAKCNSPAITPACVGIEAPRTRLDASAGTTARVPGPSTALEPSATDNPQPRDRGNRTSGTGTRFLPPTQLNCLTTSPSYCLLSPNANRQTDHSTTPNYHLYNPPLLTIPTKPDKKTRQPGGPKAHSTSGILINTCTANRTRNERKTRHIEKQPPSVSADKPAYGRAPTHQPPNQTKPNQTKP